MRQRRQVRTEGVRAMADHLGFLRFFPSRTRTDDFSAALADPGRYAAQIDRLQRRHLFDGGLYRLEEEGVSLASLVLNRSAVAQKLARSVASGTYHLRPATVRAIRVDGKQRIVFQYSLMDLIVHGVVAGILTQAMEPTLSRSLYSYRPGLSWAKGITSFADYLRAHCRSRRDPRDRGMYVLRRDVSSYTDSIPVGEDSRLWQMLAEILHFSPAPVAVDAPRAGGAWQVLREVVQPRVRSPDGVIVRRRGVATGQPISCVAFNLYLRDLDHELAATPGAYVARYSDDLLVAHPEARIARDLSSLLDRRLRELELTFNPKKSGDLYLTGAGRASTDWSEARGTTGVEFLGMRVSMDGGVALGNGKVRHLLRDAKRRAQNTARTMAGRPDGERGIAIAMALNAQLGQGRPHLAGAAGPLLAGMVTDRRQLDWLDRQLAQIVACAVSENPGAAAFRRFSYRRIRSDWGLLSLRHMRDRHP